VRGFFDSRVDGDETLSALFSSLLRFGPEFRFVIDEPVSFVCRAID